MLRGPALGRTEFGAGTEDRDGAIELEIERRAPRRRDSAASGTSTGAVAGGPGSLGPVRERGVAIDEPRQRLAIEPPRDR